jgi:multidrug efflux system membrane fusion protein
MITLGAAGDNAAVEGVKPGEMVVVDGADKLRDGSKVEIQTGEASAGPRKKGKS